MTGGKLKRIVTVVGVNVLIVGVALVLLDLVLMATGAFAPTYEYGDADVGWTATPAPGRAIMDSCVDYSIGVSYTYPRNADGVRTELSREQILNDTTRYKIAVTGDSQTDLCAPNEQTHAGVLAADLRARGIPATELPFGAGRYSPLQDYLIFKKALKPYDPDVFVLNVYTGNDFNDMLRVDDRPYFVRDSSGYRVHPPEWYRFADPGRVHRSRVRFAIRSLMDGVGIANMYFRLKFLYAAAADQAEGFGAVFRYLGDLRRSIEPTVGYQEAFTAQILNQQLFFEHFPGSAAESLDRLQALLTMVRDENPDLLLVLSAIPSYQLATPLERVDSALVAVTERLPLSFDDGVSQEQRLYEAVRGMAHQSGWLFVDNLEPLRAYTGNERLYNDFDYHLTPEGSAIVGTTQANLIWEQLSTSDSHDEDAGWEGTIARKQ